jgi:UPF0755 protein
VNAAEYICSIRNLKNTEGQRLMKSNKTYSFLTRLVILLFVIVILGWSGWLWWNNSISPINPNDKAPVVFVVNKGDGVKIIASNLAAQNLIRSPTGFYVLVKILGIERQIQAGDFRLTRAMNAKDVAIELTHGITDQWVTILEGWRDEEIATKLSKDLNIPEVEFLKYTKEGYMFPDTYLIPQNATAAAVAQIFLDNFNKKVTTKMREDAIKSGLTLNQVLVMASIVEREGRSAQDRPVIAGILLKRLKADWPLEVDATLQFALGYQASEKSWWKKYLTDDDKKINSPFNTYTNTGLPPTPICNPGLESISAVVYPTVSDYWYYIHDTTGAVHYAKTIQEHNANVTKYLQ